LIINKINNNQKIKIEKTILREYGQRFYFINSIIFFISLN